MQQNTYENITQIGVTSQRFLINLSMLALVDLREFDKWRSAAADEGCNKSMSLHAFDHLGRFSHSSSTKLRAPPPKFEKTYLSFYSLS